MPHLQLIGPAGERVLHPIVRRITSIGASTDCDVVVSGMEVADTHATLTHEPGRFLVETTARNLGFLVQGRRVRSHELRHGDVIVLGGVELAFSVLDDSLQDQSDKQSAAIEAESLQAMKRLLEFSRILSEPADVDALFDELIDQIVASSGASKGFLVLANADGSYSVRVARNVARQAVGEPSELISDDIIKSVLATRRPQIISDALTDRRFQNSLSVIRLKLSSVMCVPLIVRGDLLGAIYVGADRIANLFQPHHLDVLEVFASQAALVLRTAQDLTKARGDVKRLAAELDDVRFGSIVGSCPAMVELYKRVERVAGTDVTILIGGETGTGKELIAHEVHRRSPRAKAPFVTVNCGAIPENLIESELFGHVKGAFTGAVANQIGKFQAAHGGTLFLDEIGELPLGMQVKLLRALQERAIQRVGDSKTMAVDIRVVAATNRDLEAEVKAGRFREDLFFRLNVIGIDLPPLRERGDDVVLLARWFIQRYAAEFRREFEPGNALDDGAIRALMRFSWPGNIRQLENQIKKALVLSDGPRLTAKDLDLADDESSKVDEGATQWSPEMVVEPLSDARERWQRQYINHVLALNGGNRTKTARDLGVDPRTIFRHLEKQERNESEGSES